MIVRQLSRPFAFNSIRSGELRYVRLYLPALITSVLLVFYIMLPKPPDIWGDKHYLDYMLQIVGILPGFYIAALAAGATFANSSLDQPMPGRSAPTLEMTRMGQKSFETLSTRLFICYLFSYLSAVSLVLAFGILFAIETNPSVEYIAKMFEETLIINKFCKILQYLYVLMLTFYAAKLATITLHGLYFLAERMHQHDD